MSGKERIAVFDDLGSIWFHGAKTNLQLILGYNGPERPR